jgi:transposase InsO family protein
LDRHFNGFYHGDPKAGNKSVIMVFVDCFSKVSHLCSLSHPFSPSSMARSFMDNIFKLHGMPTSIVLDRDPTFTNKFWQDFLKIQGMGPKMSMAYHPQTYGQIEVVNKCLETYLRCFSSEKPHQWV